MRKKILAAITMLAASAMMFSTASAEHASADRYRQMFRDGKFYVEYRAERPVWRKTKIRTFKFTPVAIAAEDGQRMRRTVKDASKKGLLGRFKIQRFTGTPQEEILYDDEAVGMSQFEFMAARSELGRIGALGDKKARGKYPDVLYRDGNYYRFMNGKGFTALRMFGSAMKGIVAIRLSEDKLNFPGLNPDEEWDFVQKDLSVPDEIGIFCWDSDYHDDLIMLDEPRFIESSKKTIDEVEYDCDKYMNEIKNAAGGTIAQWIYYLYYDENGDLVRTQKIFLRDGEEYLARELFIQAFTDEIPETAFEIKKKIKVYAASIGDMKDLINQPELIEEWKKKK